MNPISFAFGFIYISGVYGLFSLSSTLRFLPAHRNIDHPSKPLRIYYRVMSVFMCQFFSFMLSGALIGALGLQKQLQEIRDVGDTEKAILMIMFPIPLMLVLYRLHARFARWMSCKEDAR